MSGQFTPTSEYSASEAPTDTSGDGIGTFIIHVTCDNPKFDETVLVLVDEEAGIDKSLAEFKDTISMIGSVANCSYKYPYKIKQIRLLISDNKHIIVTARQLFSVIWRLPRIPGLVTPDLITNIPNSNRIQVFLSVDYSDHWRIRQ